MLKYLLYHIYILALLFVYSCNKEKLKSPVASFIVVPSVSLNTTLLQGSNSQKVTDIWLYVDDKFQGVYPIGGVMPIAVTGNVKVIMYAGIKNNGIAATRIPYAFYKSIEYNQTFEVGKTYTLTPTFEYITATNFVFTDSFDSGGSIFQSTGDSVYKLISDPNKTFGGIGKSVFMSMSDAKLTSIMQTNIPYALATGGAVVYLEMNYKCNQPITIGVIGGGTEKRGAIALNPSSDWNKIYIQLTTVVSTQPTYSSYDVYVEAFKQTDVPEIYIDNLKLVSF